MFSSKKRKFGYFNITFYNLPALKAKTKHDIFHSQKKIQTWNDRMAAKQSVACDRNVRLFVSN